VRIGIALLLLWGLFAPKALAQGDGSEASGLDRVEQELELAEFEEAARLLQEIADDSRAGLDRDGAARLLRLRAVVRSALGRDRDANRDLASLVLVLEGREPGPLPQSLRRRFDRLRVAFGDRTLRVRVGIRPLGATDVRARVTAEDGEADVVERLELSCRSGAREIASSDSGTVTVRGERELVCEGRAFGPGGWLIGASTARWRSGTEPAADPSPGLATNGIDEVLLWGLGGAGVAVLLGVLIAGITVAASSSGVGGPVWVPRE